MAAQRGAAMLLKMDISGTQTTIAGLRSTSISFNEESVDVTNKDSLGARTLLAGGGVQSVSVSGSGVFTDQPSELALRTAYFAQANSSDGASAQDAAFEDFEILIPDLGTLSGKFMIASLEYAGEYNGEVTYSVTLESAQYITFASA